MIFSIGLSFWKSARRRIYAVLQNITIDSSSDEEDESDPRQDRWSKLIEKINAIENDIGEIKTYAKDSKTDLPLRLQGDIRDTFATAPH